MTIITEKVTTVGITMAKAMNAVTTTAMKAAAVITVSKPLCDDHIRTELSRIMERTGSMVPSFSMFSNTFQEARKGALIETHSSAQLPSSFLDACRSWIEGGNLTDILRITGEDRLPKAENLCGNSFSFELNFLIGNICDLYEEPENASFDPIPALQLLQRKIKYGVPTKTAASICEKVFNDQQLSIGISEIIGNSEVDSDEIIGAILAREQEVIDYLEPFPTFFTDRIRFLSDSV